jgi:hypothetical protein
MSEEYTVVLDLELPTTLTCAYSSYYRQSLIGQK